MSEQWKRRVPEASRPFVIGQERGGSFICLHGRQLTICPQCCTAAVERQKALDAGLRTAVQRAARPTTEEREDG